MKKNVRAVPKDIQVKLKTISSKEIVVGCAVKFKRETLAEGRLEHLGVVLTDRGLQFPSAVIPSATQGKYSEWNIHGHEVIRRDLPKEKHYNTIETPNWGDSYNGTHTVNLPYEKYPRDFYPPRELEISIECKDARRDLPVYVMAFQVNEVLDKTSSDFARLLLEDLNLLQENVGACGVEEADMPMAEYAKSLHVSWEILPLGTLDETLDRLFRGKSPTTEEKDVAEERYKFFSSLKPKSLVFGQSGFRRYFGALVEDNLVIFENMEYGNAIYILFENWEELSRLSRLDLMSGKFDGSFERVIHAKGWKDAVKDVVKKRRAEKQQKS